MFFLRFEKDILIILGVFCVLSVSRLNAQSRAVISGKMSNLPSRILHFHYRNNPLIFEESENYVGLDANDSFNVVIQLAAPQIIYVDLAGKRLRLYVAPNDNLNLNYDVKKKVSDITFEGTNAANNIFLARSDNEFPDWINETELKTAQKTNSASDFLNLVETKFKQKKLFSDNYPVSEIANFSSDFLDFIFYDLHFWRARQLIEYYAENKNNADPLRVPDESFLSFIYETEISTNSASMNDNYLVYLQKYLAYLNEKNVTANKVSNELIAETMRTVQIVKPNVGNVFVLEDPFTSKEIVDWINVGNPATFLNIITTEKYKYVGNDTTFDDTFLKVRTMNGRVGWVPNSSVYLKEERIADAKRIPRYCLDSENPMCGFEKYISGRGLFIAGALDILRSLLKSDPAIVALRLNSFCQANVLFPEINNYLIDAFEASLANIEHGNKDFILPARTILRTSHQVKEIKNLVSSSQKTMELLSNASTKAIAAEQKSKENFVQRDYFTLSPLPTIQKIVVEIPNTNLALVNQLIFFSAFSPPIEIADKLDERVNTFTQRDSLNGTTVSDTALMASTANFFSKKENVIAVVQDMPPTFSEIQNIGVEKSDQKTALTYKNVKVNDALPLDNTMEKREEIKTIASENKKPESSGGFSSSVSKSNFTARQIFLPDASLNPEVEIVPAYNAEKSAPIKFNGLTINEHIPDFTFLDINGKEVKSQALAGKIIYLDFWATWCAPCQAEMTRAQGMADRLRDKDIVFVFISMDTDSPAWRSQVADQKYLGLHGNDSVIIPINFMIEGIPNHFIIDKNGHIAYNSLIKSHYTSEQMVEKLLSR